MTVGLRFVRTEAGHNVCMTPQEHTRARLDLNRLSKETAEHDGDEWTCLELEVLMLSTGTEADFLDVAEVLGRTIEACKQRYYVTRRDGVQVFPRPRTARGYRGWTCDMGDE